MKRIILLVACVVLLSGCGPKDGGAVAIEKPNLAPHVELVAEHAREIEANSVEVAKSLDALSGLATDIIAGPSALGDILAAQEANADTAERASDLSKTVVPRLQHQRYVADAAFKAKLASDERAKRLAGELEKERSKANRTMNTMLVIAILAGVALIAGGIFLAVKVNFKTGLALALGGLIITSVAAVVIKYFAYIAIAGGLMLLAAMGFGAYLLYRSYKEGKVAVHFATIAQYFKAHLPEAIREKALAGLKATVPAEYQKEYEALLASGNIPTNSSP